MAAPLDPAKVDHAVEMYLAGESLKKILSDSGVSPTKLCNERRRRGIPPRTIDLDVDSIVAAYLNGASEYALGRQYGVSRFVIQKRLLDAGVERRGSREAGLVRAAQMTRAERKAQAAKANRAVRHRKIPQILKMRHALVREGCGGTQSPGEETLLQLLVGRGVAPIIQRAVGPYNVDLALAPVAVEVLGGPGNLRVHYADRTPYILDEGWHLVLVWNVPHSRITPDAADYIVAFCDEIRRHPPATSQYRVISGEGKVLAARGREDNEFPFVRPPARRKR